MLIQIRLATWRGSRSLLALGSVGGGEACDLLIFRWGLTWLGKDRSLFALDSAYTAFNQPP